jgi:EAL domain-containing protein (putative c-di-GMP-specific phosphodiesterase class I)/CheY-like chemotaxis protein
LVACALRAERDAMETERPPPPKPAEDSRARVLLVEDEIALAKLFKRTLESGPYVVEVAWTGDRVSDVNLPGVTGIDLLASIRAYDLNVPVVLMSGTPTMDTAIQAVNLGAVQYLTKPFANADLVAACHRAVQLGASVRREREDAKPTLVSEGLGDATLSAALDRALDGMWMAFQPIVKADSIFAYEALMRSAEPVLPNPPAVLEAAERLGRLHDLGRHVRDLVARAAAEAPPSVLLFVNLHTADLLDDTLYASNSPLTKYAERVVLEVTERASIDDVERLLPRISMLRVLGFRIALDDLGAGYAGLSSFAELEPEFVKLDMSLVRDVHLSQVRQKLVRAIGGLSSELNMQLVAEGVETIDESRCVQSLGCGLLQGYYFARPEKGFGSASNLAS